MTMIFLIIKILEFFDHTLFFVKFLINSDCFRLIMTLYTGTPNVLCSFCKFTVLIYNRGTDELFGVMDRVAIVNSTLGKALGGAAGK